MQPDFRFRIHRIAARFPDKCSADVFVLPDGAVNGTLRNTATKTGFVPISFNVGRSHVDEMKEAFEDTDASDLLEPSWVNVGYGESGSPLMFKYLYPPPSTQRDSAIRVLWEKCIEICDMCVQQGNF